MGLGSALGSIGRAIGPRAGMTQYRTPPFIGEWEDMPPTEEESGGGEPAPPKPAPSVAGAIGSPEMKAPATYRPEISPEQQKALDIAKQGAPAHPKHGKLRSIGEALTSTFLGPLSTEIWDHDYANQQREYQHNLGNAALAAKMRQEAEKEASEVSDRVAGSAVKGKQAEHADTQILLDATKQGFEIDPDNPAPPANGQPPAPPREGTRVSIAGKSGIIPSKAQQARDVATARNEAMQATYRPLPKEIADSLGLPPDLKVPVTELDAYSRIYETKIKDRGLKFESHVDENTGDVTTVGRDPVTGAEKFRDTLKGIARKRPQINNFGANEQRKDRTAGLKAYTPALESAERFNVMSKNYEDAIKNHDQQAMLSLLANHLGMTMGLQKGSRLTKDIIHEAEQSRPWLQGMTAKFDGNGYLAGVVLSPEQMRQMVSLGRERFAEDIAKGRSEAKYMGIDDDGPERTHNKSTINFYIALANGDVEKARALARADGWSVR